MLVQYMVDKFVFKLRKEFEHVCTYTISNAVIYTNTYCYYIIMHNLYIMHITSKPILDICMYVL